MPHCWKLHVVAHLNVFQRDDFDMLGWQNYSHREIIDCAVLSRPSWSELLLIYSCKKLLLWYLQWERKEGVHETEIECNMNVDWNWKLENNWNICPRWLSYPYMVKKDPTKAAVIVQKKSLISPEQSRLVMKFDWVAQGLERIWFRLTVLLSILGSIFSSEVYSEKDSTLILYLR